MATPTPTTAPTVSSLVCKGVIKQVLSGDSVIIRGPTNRVPPLPDRQLNLSNVTAPRLGRRPGGNVKAEESKDEPFAFEAREFLRKKLLGKVILFVVDYKAPASGREYGSIHIGNDIESGENVAEAIVQEGLASVRREGKGNERLLELEEAAKMAQRGKWSINAESHTREVIWQVTDPRVLLDKLARKPVPAIVEHVRDGSTVRVLLTATNHYITIMMSGVRTPGFKLDSDGKLDRNAVEPFADEARLFTELRLLQQDVEVILESVNNQNFVGSIIHPNGNIGELLLREGFARCIDWSMGFVTGGAEKLRAAEKLAKERKLRIWREYQENANSGPSGLKGQHFSAIVTEIVNGDSLVVKSLADGSIKKIFLGSIRAPRLPDERSQEEKDADPKQQRASNFRPLYDVPLMFEAREYMRKKLIGNQVQVTVDYVQPADKGFQEKICCTVKSEGTNIGEALLSKGFATVVRYRQDDDSRASDYDLLLAAEARAVKDSKGVYSKKEIKTHTVVDITGDSIKAKQFLPFFKRAGRTTAVVEFVASGSRLRLYVPRESRIITFLLAGISCPRGDRPDPKTRENIPGDPFGNEARNFTKELCLQRDVEIEVDDIDKAGNFIGWLWFGNKNLSLSLVEAGFASVHFTAEKTPYFRSLKVAEDAVKERRENIWRDYVEIKDEIKSEDDKLERKLELKSVVVTHVTDDLHVFVQYAEDGDKLESLTNEIRRELVANPPLAGSFTPKRDTIFAAKFSADGEWYRAKVIKELPNRQFQVQYIDYGNGEVISGAKCAALPSLPGATANGYAKEYILACVTLPVDPDYAADSNTALKEELGYGGRFQLNIEYKTGGAEYVTLINETNDEDVAEILLREGLLHAENRKERRLMKLVKSYKSAEKEAKTEHRGVWQYGDVTEDDAREFGMGGR